MRKIDSRFEDNDAFDERGILKDGAVARVRMSMRDGLPDRPLTHDEQMIKVIEHDARRRRSLHVEAPDNLPFSLNRAGFRHLVAADGDRRQQADIAAARQRVLDARRAYVDDLESAWKSPPTGAGERGAPFSSKPQIGGQCTLNGWNGTYQDDGNGNIVCVIDRGQPGDSAGETLQQLQRDHASVMDQVYREHETWLQNQWKTR